MIDYFAVMGLKRTASDREIREAYRRLAKQHHPDSNPSPSSSQKMRELNQAKDVLFDPVKREEHRVTLVLAERPFHTIPSYRPPVTPNWGPPGYARTQPKPEPPQKGLFRWVRPRSHWDKVWRGWFMTTVVAIMLFVAGVVAYELSRTNPSSTDPISEIISRYRTTPPLPFEPVQVEDTTTVPDDTLPNLKRHGDLLLNLGDYRMASKFYVLYLKKDSTNLDVIKNLSYAYFKRGKYAQSLDVLARQMHGDSNLVVAYYNIGVLFLKEEKPFDARNAFQAAIQVGEKMQREGRGATGDAIDYLIKARSELSKLE